MFEFECCGNKQWIVAHTTVCNNCGTIYRLDDSSNIVKIPTPPQSMGLLPTTGHLAPSSHEQTEAEMATGDDFLDAAIKEISINLEAARTNNADLSKRVAELERNHKRATGKDVDDFHRINILLTDRSCRVDGCHEIDWIIPRAEGKNPLYIDLCGEHRDPINLHHKNCNLRICKPSEARETDSLWCRWCETAEIKVTVNKNATRMRVLYGILVVVNIVTWILFK